MKNKIIVLNSLRTQRMNLRFDRLANFFHLFPSFSEIFQYSSLETLHLNHEECGRQSTYKPPTIVFVGGGEIPSVHMYGYGKNTSFSLAEAYFFWKWTRQKI